MNRFNEPNCRTKISLRIFSRYVIFHSPFTNANLFEQHPHSNKSNRQKFAWLLALFGVLTGFAQGAFSEEFGEASPSTATQRLPETIVESAPFEKTLFESAQPISVLSGTELTLKAKGTLGDTLASEPGVSSSSFGPGASRPIIRGLGGDRIRILENGIGTQDVSNTSPDHAVAIDPASVEKIEVVRGPASLLYGTSAVGGIVNIFDNRIPETLPDGPVSGNAELRGGTVDKERTGVISLNAPAGPFAFHVDGLKRRTDDIDIPGFARTEELRENGPELEYPEPQGTLPFSATDTTNFTLGSSYIAESGFLGAAVSQFETEYGVPNGEKNISIDGRRNRLDIRGKLFEPVDGITSMDLKVGIVDYDHTEFEGSEAGTKFKNNGVDARYEITHQAIGPFAGVVGFQYQHSDFAALGEEAFQPPTKANVGSAFIFEEFQVGSQLSFQFGGRFDYNDLQAEDYRAFGSDFASDISRSIPTFSESAGIVWSPDQEYALAFSVAHTERAPSGQELFANGPHVATAAFEIGDPDLDTEKSLGIDLTLRKKTGKITGSIGGFYNRFTDYVALLPNGETQDEFAVYEFTSIPANFWGLESQIAYHFLDSDPNVEDFSIDYQTDWVWAEDRNTGDPIPRIPPLRMKWGLNYSREGLFAARLEAQHVFDQNRSADFETDTDGYTFLNATITKQITVDSTPLNLFVRGSNLLNDNAREHTSFIKDLAPLPGANVVAGIQVRF